jgi:hypothetical protein
VLAPIRHWLSARRSGATPRGTSNWLDAVASWLGFGCVLLCIAIAVRPVFRDLGLYGGHDWDEMSAHRLLTVKALLQFGQLPLWMPYGCGGYSEWGNVQGASNLVSPFLPFYLLLELRHALRVELIGTLLLSAVGTWLLAGEFTRSIAARTFACLVFVASGRFALQAATGHLWHLQYCYLPWVFWGFERLLAEKRLALRPLCVGAVALAAMVYAGGIYPLPHAALLLGTYGLARAALDKDWRPILALAALGGLSIGLSAPKLFANAAAPGRLVSFATRAVALALSGAVTLWGDGGGGFRARYRAAAAAAQRRFGAARALFGAGRRYWRRKQLVARARVLDARPASSSRPRVRAA